MNAKVTEQGSCAVCGTQIVVTRCIYGPPPLPALCAKCWTMSQCFDALKAAKPEVARKWLFTALRSFSWSAKPAQLCEDPPNPFTKSPAERELDAAWAATKLASAVRGMTTLADAIQCLRNDRQEARDAAMILAHAYDSDSRPPNDVLVTARAYPLTKD